MPSSHYHQLNEILDLIIETNPQKLLDIGIGYGKYGFLSREYLEIWDPAIPYGAHKRQIDGIEAFEPYLTPLHYQVYDTIFKGNALDILPGITDRYDLILMIDVLEHFSHEDGLRILKECRRCGKNILISVPRMMSEQEDVYGNPFETHRYNWSGKDLAPIRDKFYLYNYRSLICFIGEDSRRIGKIIHQRRRRRRIVRILELTGLKKPLKYLLGKKTGSASKE